MSEDDTVPEDVRKLASDITDCAIAERYNSGMGDRLLSTVTAILMADRAAWNRRAPIAEGIPSHAEIRIAPGVFALCDWSDWPLVRAFAWRPTSARDRTIYAQAWGAGPKDTRDHVMMHRLILPLPAGQYVDHINGNGLDNRRANLRAVTKQQNCWNQSARREGQFKGVHHRKDTGLWRAYITKDRKRISLGHFESAEDAARAYNAAAKEAFGEHARLNQID